MSISTALSSALSGLTASSRAADVVSSNLANVMTEGYAPRRLGLEARGPHLSGVKVTGLARHVDQGLLADRRLADSQLAHADTASGFLGELEGVVGTPDMDRSISARLSAFDTALTSAAGRPEAENRLQAAVLHGKELASALNAAADHIATRRTEADGAIAGTVETVNDTLKRIRTLNIQIARAGQQTREATTLLDQRQALIDHLSEHVPVRQVERDNGAVALFTTGGKTLLDGSATTLEFTPSNLVAPHMTIDNGLLSRLRIDGRPVDAESLSGPDQGGRLAGLFNLRDTLAVKAQTRLDAVARDLVERFQDASVDSTRAPGDPGLFTDDAGTFDPVDETGLAGRVALNALVDPTRGGDLWRLRDGLGAGAPGPAGNSSTINQLKDALIQERGLASGDLGLTSRTAASHQASLIAMIGQDRLSAEQNQSFAAATRGDLRERELANSVDSDAEMQRLMQIEQAYGANARMIQTLDEMIETLLRI